MKKIILAIAIVVLFSAWGVVYYVSNSDSVNNDLQSASVRFSWIPSASFAGDVAGLTMFDEDYGLDLEAGFGGPGINVAQMVQSGQDTFGYLAADEVLAANDKGADFVIIGVIADQSPAGFVSLKKSGIKTPKDLVGRTVGTLPFGNTNMIYEAMLEINNIDRNFVNETIISSDLKPFLSGSYDVHPVFVYDETVSLDREGIEYDVILPSDFGVDFKGPVYFTKRSTLENNPELVKAFVYTMADGWNYAIENPEDAVQMLVEFAPEADYERELAVMKKAIPYFAGYNNQPLNSDMSVWESTVQVLEGSGTVANPIDVQSTLRFKYINDYYVNR